MSRKKKILFLVGSPNQTTQMHQIANHLQNEYECWFTQFFPDSLLEKWALRAGLLENTIMSGKFKEKADRYLAEHNLPVDYMGQRNHYELAVLCSDLIVPRRLRNIKTVWVQEGMTDPVNFMTRVVQKVRIMPRYLTLNTSLNGASNLCDIYCVASDGYKEHFARMGTDPNKIVVTGMPNYDNLHRYLDNDFPYRNYVLVVTSDIRETLRYENRPAFLRECVRIAAGRPLIFKLHPNENAERAIREIREVVGPEALVFTDGDPYAMIANCTELICQYSTLVYVGIVLGKKVHSYFDVEHLRRLAPLQNGGTSAARIADICRRYIAFPRKDGPAFLHSIGCNSTVCIA